MFDGFQKIQSYLSISIELFLKIGKISFENDKIGDLFFDYFSRCIKR